MTSEELFQEAYAAHHKQEEFASARSLYEAIIATYPDSKEAQYARVQLENLEQDATRSQQRQASYEKQLEEREGRQLRSRRRSLSRGFGWSGR